MEVDKAKKKSTRRERRKKWMLHHQESMSEKRAKVAEKKNKAKIINAVKEGTESSHGKGFKSDLAIKVGTTKDKRSKKLQKSVKSRTEQISRTEASNMDEDDKIQKTDKNQKPKKNEKDRGYVLFVGNLSYKATSGDVFAHFKKAGKINQVRFLTDKVTGKSRGFAFIDFEDVKGYKQGLLLHHTMLKGRKINVEFTSIGGKNSKRTERLKKKNEAMERFKSLRDQEDNKDQDKKSS